MPLRPQRVLLIGETRACQVLGRVLSRLKFRITTAQSSDEALFRARKMRFDVFVVDFRLPDLPGIDFVLSLRPLLDRLPTVLLSDLAKLAVVVKDLKLITSNSTRRSMRINHLVATASSKGIVTAIQRSQARTLSRPGSMSERWAMHVLKACDSDADLKTLTQWASFVGMSYSSLCESCRILNIRPHDARDFARVLRALLQSNWHHCPLETKLDVSDRRTLYTLLTRSGFTRSPQTLSPSVDNFFLRQQFVPHDNEGLKVLRRLVNTGGEHSSNTMKSPTES